MILSPEWSDIEPGDVIVWDALTEGGHKHVGFCVSFGVAISNMSRKGSPGRHSIVYTGFGYDEDKKAQILKCFRLKSP